MTSFLTNTRPTAILPLESPCRSLLGGWGGVAGRDGKRGGGGEIVEGEGREWRGRRESGGGELRGRREGRERVLVSV